MQIRLPARTKRILKILAATAGALAVLALGALIYLQVNFHSLLEAAFQRFERHSGCSVETGSATLKLFPSPVITLEGVCLKKDGFAFHAAYALVAPSLVSLFEGQFFPEQVTLMRPQAEGLLPFAAKELASRIDGEGTAQDETPGDMLKRLFPKFFDLRIMDGRCQIRDQAGAALDVDGLEVQAEVQSLLNRARARFGVTRLVFKEADGRVWALKNFKASGGTRLSNPIERCRFTVDGAAELPLLSTRFTARLKFRGGAEGIVADGDIKGTYVYDAAPIHFALAGKAYPAKADATGNPLPYADLLPQQPAPGDLRIEISNMSMGKDSAGLDAILSFGGKGPAITGRASVTRLSLTRWLGFGRWITPGLQVALDQVSEGIIDFTLDRNRLHCPRVAATAQGYEFRGKGGVASFADPVVFLDLKSGEVDLGVAMPESLGDIPQPPSYVHRPLTSLTLDELWGRKPRPSTCKVVLDDTGDGRNAKETADAKKAKESKAAREACEAAQKNSDADVCGYDINLSADLVHYGPLKLRKAKVAILPTPSGRPGVSDCAIKASADLYSGPFKGQCVIRGTHLTPVFEFDVQTKGVQAGQLARDCPFLPFVKGTLEGRGKARAKGRDIDLFLASLHGEVKMSGAKGAFLTDGRKTTPFDKLALDCDLQSAQRRGAVVGVNGKWRASHAGNGWTGQADSTGTVWLAFAGKEKGISFKNLASTIAVHRLERLAHLPGSGIELGLKGGLSYSSAAGQCGLENAGLTLPGLKARVTLLQSGAAGKAKSYAGTVHEASVDLPLFLRAVFAKTPELHKEFTAFKGSFAFQADGSRIAVKHLRTRAAGAPLAGSLDVALAGKRPQIGFDLDAGSLDLDALLKNGKEGKEGDGSAGASDPGHELDLRFLKDFDAQGTARIASLTVSKLRFTGVKAPLALKEGRLSISGLQAGAYGGSLSVTGRVNFDKGLAFNIGSTARNVQLGEAMKAKGVKSDFKGKAAVSCNLQAAMARTGDLPRQLSGKLHFSTGKGSFQSADNEGRLKGKPTEFTSISGSATIDHGVFRTEDFLLKDSGMNVHGKGKVDLNAMRIDMDVTVDMRGLPVIPVYVVGPLAKPETKVSGARVVLNTFTGIIQGTAGFVGGFFRLFRR
ncbi:MAG: AsmA family protein [Desulfovibrio sp.]|nr:AsmA family protein [Desulfovibrio sp.]